MQLEWLNEKNIDEIKSIASSEFQNDINLVGNINLYDKVLKGDKLGNIDLKYGLIKEQDIPIGIIGYYIPEIDSKAAWLGWFAIKKVYRKQGFGKKALYGLMNYLKKSHPEVEVIRTYTGMEQGGALRFYEKVGFEAEKTIFTVGNEKEPTIILDYSLNGKPIKPWNKLPIW